MTVTHGPYLPFHSRRPTLFNIQLLTEKEVIMPLVKYLAIITCDGLTQWNIRKYQTHV